MADAGGFTPTDVVALLASHSVAGADTVDPTVNNFFTSTLISQLTCPQRSPARRLIVRFCFLIVVLRTIYSPFGFIATPELFDTQLFIEVQLRGTQFPG
jgi:hypothetical protein